MHDEAAFHLNAKEVVLYGKEALKDCRPTYILVPVQFLIGLISFSIFGCTLLALRMPYILLNVIGNLLFFNALKRKYNIYISALSTLAFALYSQRLAFGKVAMSESLILPLILIMIWVVVCVENLRWKNFWTGFLSVLIPICKCDTVIIFFVSGIYIFGKTISLWREGKRALSRSTMMYYLFGAAIPALLWIIFLYIAGFDNFRMEFNYALGANLNISPFFRKMHINNPLTLDLFLGNIRLVYEHYKTLFLASGICLITFIYSLVASKDERKNPLSWVTITLIMLLLFKLMTSCFLAPRRLLPCFPIPFLLAAQSANFLLNMCVSQHKRKYSAYIFLIIILVICYYPYVLTETAFVTFKATYRISKQAEEISQLIDKKYTSLFFDGRFSYIALLIPSRFIDIPPDNNGKDFYEIEGNPKFARKLLSENNNIRYVFCMPEYTNIMTIVEKEFKGKLLYADMNSGGLLFEIPRKSKDYGSK